MLDDRHWPVSAIALEVNSPQVERLKKNKRTLPRLMRQAGRQREVEWCRYSM